MARTRETIKGLREHASKLRYIAQHGGQYKFSSSVPPHRMLTAFTESLVSKQSSKGKTFTQLIEEILLESYIVSGTSKPKVVIHYDESAPSEQTRYKVRDNGGLDIPDTLSDSHVNDLQDAHDMGHIDLHILH